MFNANGTFTVLRFSVLGLALCLPATATAGDEDYVPPLTIAPMPEISVESMWEGFAQDVGLTSEELASYRADLPDAQIDDLMWTRWSQNFNKVLLESNAALTADDLLFEKLDIQLLVKEMADILYGSVTKPHPASSSASDEALWDHFAVNLADFVPLRGSERQFTTADALWVKIARDYDAATLRQRPMTAYDLLDAPDYLLHRKLIVDRVVESMLDCAVCAVNPHISLCPDKERCDRNYEVYTDFCRRILNACGRNGFARGVCNGAYQQCICVQDCLRCECYGGHRASDPDCFLQCNDGDTVHNCTVVDPLSSSAYSTEAWLP